MGLTHVKAISDPSNKALRIFRTLSLKPRADGRAWAVGQTIALKDGIWAEAEGDERTLSLITEILTPPEPA